MDGFNFENYFLDGDTEKKHDKKLVLVIYDITDNKRRYKFVRFIERYGQRVQKSAFELILDSRQYRKLLKEITAVIDPQDNIRVYKLPLSGEVTAWGGKFTDEEEVIII